MKLLPLKKDKRIFRRVFIIVIYLFSISSYYLFSVKPANIGAQSNSQIWAQISALQDKMAQLNDSILKEKSQISSLNGKIQNNQGTISQLQSIISQKQQLISEKQDEISLLNKSISQEQNDIDDLNTRINKLYSIFVQRAKKSYEESFTNPFLITLSNSSIVDVFANLEYFSATRQQDSNLLSEMKNDKFLMQQKLTDLSTQQATLAKAQDELVKEKADLLKEQSSLNTQNNSYKSLQNNLSNDIKLSQDQLNKIAQQAASLRDSVVQSGTLGSIESAPGYYSQEDPAWAGKCIGLAKYSCYSGATIGSIGCLVAAAAMVLTYYGVTENGRTITPAVLANNTSYFDGVLWNWNSFGLNLQWYYNLADVDAQLAQGHPVLAELYYGSYGTHWIVLMSKTGNDYRINDPYSGPNKLFSQLYRKSQLAGTYVVYSR